MFEMKLATCATLIGVLPESTDSLKTSYLSRENTYRLVTADFEVGEVRYALKLWGGTANFWSTPISKNFSDSRRWR